MKYKVWASFVVTLTVIALWAAGAFVMVWYVTNPLTQLLSWLLVTFIAFFAEWKGIGRIVRGQTISEVLNSPWE